MSNIFETLISPAGNGPGIGVGASLMATSKTFVYGGNGSATPPFVIIEISNAEIASEFSPIAQFNSPGVKVLDVACRWIRTRVANYQGGGAPEVSVSAPENGSFALAELTSPDGDGVGPEVDISSLPDAVGIQVVGDFAGACIIEISNDGTTFAQIESFYSGGGLRSRTLTGVSARVRRVGAGSGGGRPHVRLAGVNNGASGSSSGGAPWSMVGSFQSPITGGPVPVQLPCEAGNLYVVRSNEGDTLAPMLPGAPVDGAQVMFFVFGDEAGIIEVNPQGGDLIQGQAFLNISPNESGYARHLFVYDGSGTWLHFSWGDGF